MCADATAGDLDDAMAAARRAFDETSWSTDVAFRVRCLRQLQQAMTAHVDDLRALTIAETGSPLFFTRSAALDEPVAAARLGGRSGRGLPVDDGPRGRRRPWACPLDAGCGGSPTGVVAAITPWNVPHQINLAKIGPALAAGNTVVLEPAPDTPWCATVVGRLVAEETDIPAGVLNIVTSSVPDFGAPSGHRWPGRSGEFHRLDGDGPEGHGRRRRAR